MIYFRPHVSLYQTNSHIVLVFLRRMATLREPLTEIICKQRAILFCAIGATLSRGFAVQIKNRVYAWLMCSEELACASFEFGRSHLKRPCHWNGERIRKLADNGRVFDLSYPGRSAREPGEHM